MVPGDMITKFFVLVILLFSRTSFAFIGMKKNYTLIHATKCQLVAKWLHSDDIKRREK